MSPDRQIALLARELAETKATLAAKLEGEDLEEAIGNPFSFVADQIGTLAAIVLFIRFDVRSLGEALRALAVVLSFKTEPPPLQELLDDLDEQDGRSPRDGWRSRCRNGSEMTKHAVALARSRAEGGASRGGPDLKRAIGEPFEFLCNQIGQEAAVAFFLKFNRRSIDVALRALGWMLAYHESPPSMNTLLSEMVGEEREEFADVDVSSLTIQ